jgi:hypothetical protein
MAIEAGSHFIITFTNWIMNAFLIFGILVGGQVVLAHQVTLA